MLLNWIIPLLIGWLAGWVVNYFSDVLPVTRRLSRHICPECQTPFSIRGYLFFRACPNRHKRPARLWVVQFVMVVFSIYTFSRPPLNIGYWVGMILLIYLVVVFVIDVEHHLILHPTSLFGSILALTLGLYTHGIAPTLWGGLAGFLILIAFYFFGVIFTKLRAKRMEEKGMEPDDEEAFGQGDVILVTILGLLVGWPLIWFTILISIFLAGGISVVLVTSWVVRRQFKANALMNFIPLGPYYVLGAALVIYFPGFLSALIPN
jgi:leader peptidase (prepilin peptidase)/N-methyltransferase